MLRVGFVGLGAMGMPMARNVMKAGFPLSVWARRPENAAEIRGEGAGWADSPAQLAARCDILIVIVSNSDDVEEVVIGTHGLLEGANKGSVIVDMSTIAPSVSRFLAERCARDGVGFLDAPVSGGTQGAKAGTLTIMAGGDADTLERANPVLETMGKRIYHVGPPGSGEVVKLVNNILVGVIAAGISEAFVLGAKSGLSIETMAEVIQASTGASWQLGNQFPLRAFTGTFEPGFMTDLLVKDLDLALALGASECSPLFLTPVARQLFGEAQAKGFGSSDYTSVLRVVEAIAGVEVRSDHV